MMVHAYARTIIGAPPIVSTFRRLWNVSLPCGVHVESTDGGSKWFRALTLTNQIQAFHDSILQVFLVTIYTWGSTFARTVTVAIAVLIKHDALNLRSCGVSSYHSFSPSLPRLLFSRTRLRTSHGTSGGVVIYFDRVEVHVLLLYSLSLSPCLTQTTSRPNYFSAHGRKNSLVNRLFHFCFQVPQWWRSNQIASCERHLHVLQWMVTKEGKAIEVLSED